jgi:hypothetical protein
MRNAKKALIAGGCLFVVGCGGSVAAGSGGETTQAPPAPTLRLARGGPAVRSVIDKYCRPSPDGGVSCATASLAGPLPLFRAAVGARVTVDTRRPATDFTITVGGHSLRAKRLTETRWQIRTPRPSGLAELATKYTDGTDSEALVRIQALARR